MEFVVLILTNVFFKSQAEAETLMLQVHHSDKDSENRIHETGRRGRISDDED